jgi:glycosyltransferase involved in cell wall biosynthesis
MRFSDDRNAYDRLGLMVVTHRVEFLDECLSSVADQTVAPSAIILVDNGSGTDAVNQVARRYGIAIVRLDSPVSICAARNIGCWALEDCDLIVNLDGDDVIKPRFIEVYWSTARDRQADVVFGAAELIGSQQGVVFTREELGQKPDLRRKNFVSANSLFKRRLWQEVSGFDSSIVYYEDWDFWLSLAQRGATFEHVDEPLWSYRRHEGSRMLAIGGDDPTRSKQMIRKKHRRHIYGIFQWRRVLWKVASIRTRIRARSAD